MKMFILIQLMILVKSFEIESEMNFLKEPSDLIDPLVNLYSKILNDNQNSSHLEHKF
jgi:hypothetical protein